MGPSGRSAWSTRPRSWRRSAAAALAVAAVFLAGCGAAEGTSQARNADGTLRVTATTTQITDMVARVGGDAVEVEGLMGPGVDPHLYEPSQRDTRALTEADAVFYHGLSLEGRMQDLLAGAAELVPTVQITAPLPEERLLRSADYAGQYDPHVWFDPTLWAQTVDPVVEQLARLRPDRRHDFERNAEQYRQEVLASHDYAEERLSEIPADRRVLVTSHDAFGYFGAAYDFEVRGLQGISTEDEAGVGDVRALADFLVTGRIPAVFTESSIPRRSVEAVQAAARDRGWDLRIPDKELYGDAMGDPGTAEGTYPGMVRANADTIAAALASNSDEG